MDRRRRHRGKILQPAIAAPQFERMHASAKLGDTHRFDIVERLDFLAADKMIVRTTQQIKPIILHGCPRALWAATFHESRHFELNKIKKLASLGEIELTQDTKQPPLLQPDRL